MHPDRPAGPVYLAFRPTTPVGSATAVIAAVKASGREARLLVAAPPRDTVASDQVLEARPSVAKLRAELSAKADDASARAVAIAEALQAATAPCGPVVRVFGDVASDDPEEKARRLAKVAGTGT